MTGSNSTKNSFLLLVKEKAIDYKKSEQTSNDDFQPVQYSEDFLATEFTKRYSKTLKYVPRWGWLEWSGKVWKKVTTEIIGNYARVVCREMATQVKSTLPSGSNLPRSLSSKRTISAVVAIAQGDPKHTADINDWDLDHWKLNTPAGIVDLRNGAILPHDALHKMTMITTATPDDSDCPNWHALLDHICGDDEALREYLKCLCGYILIGDPREETLHFLYGGGGNGKGSFLETLVHILGSYATTAGFDTFVSSANGRHPTDLAKLNGVRLVTAQEVNDGAVWDMGRIKAVTGRDSINARFMRQDFFEFDPRFKLLVGANQKPRFPVVDDAVKRRLHLIPFTRPVPKDIYNRDLKTILKNEEANGILTYCIEGCLLYQRNGLTPPPSVVNATNIYLDGEDIFSQWMNECCVLGTEHFEKGSALWASFDEWCKREGHIFKGSRTFYQTLEQRGFLVRKNSSANVRLGIALKIMSGTSGTIKHYGVKDDAF